MVYLIFVICTQGRRVDCSYRNIIEQMLLHLKCAPKMVLKLGIVAAIIEHVGAGNGVSLIRMITFDDMMI